MKIIIGADLVPTKTNKDLFTSGNVIKLFGRELLKDIKDSDVRIFNLETPLIESEDSIKKLGPTLGVNTCVINGIKKIDPTFITLANNHIMDHNVSGLKSTIATLEKNNIEFGGVGNNISEANKMWIKEINGKRIGIYACAEHEFSIATNDKPGANPFDYIDSYKCIEDNKNNCDFIIVLYHGGKEYYPYPSPLLQKRCREFINRGADFVVCQHSHCIGCEETYNGKKIVYGQGNFLFDKTNRIEWNHGLLLELILDKDSNYKLDYVVLTKNDNCIRKATKDEYSEVIDKYKIRSKEIKDDSFVKKTYKKYAMENIDIIFNKTDLIPNTFVSKFINKFTKNKLLNIYFKKIYLRKMSYKIANVIECEAWNELLQQILDEYNK